ncbi:MAG: hypothetical protein AMXMBFR25_07710 [Lysobacterales bacterium]|nr:hypothetical protein [Xanthomonadales bacterium]
MSHTLKSLCVALALACAGGVAAQNADADGEQLRRDLAQAKRQLAEVGRRVAELSAQIGDDSARVQMFRYLGNPDRAVIGVILADGGSDGVGVGGVTPDGPADKAGLRAGDTIVAVRGARLAGERPLQALREALKDLKAGDQVAIVYRRDGREQTAQLTAERQGSVAFFGGPEAKAFVFDDADFVGDWSALEDMGERIEAIIERRVGEGVGNRLDMLSMIGMGGLRLVSLNPGLARYFGVARGALVLEVDPERYQGIEPGDVILEVAGKAVENPRAAMRELANQDSGERVELLLQRERAAQRVTVRVPEKHAFRLPPAPPEPPEPPEPPAPPAAPGAHPMQAPQVPRPHTL